MTNSSLSVKKRSEMGKASELNQLADNPAAAAALVRNHDQANQDAQYLQNLTTLQGRYQVADSALGNVTQVLTRALSLGTEGANGGMSGRIANPLPRKYKAC